MTVDGHLDTLLRLVDDEKFNFFSDSDKYHVNYNFLRQGQVKIAVFAIFVENKYKPQLSWQRTIKFLDKFYQLQKKSEDILLINSAREIEEVLNSDKIGIILGVEGADCIFDLSALRILYKLGVRLITLTWNNRNQLADGVGEIYANGGVTHLGKKVIQEMNKLGMIIDVSHLSPASFWDVMNYSKQPVVASHSNAKSVCNHPRNLTDQQIKQIANNDGLIGINFYPRFLNSNGTANFNDIKEHMDYIRSLVGVNVIGLGSDFDGIEDTPAGLENIGKLPALKAYLSQNGYCTEELNKIFQDNWVNLFNQVMEV